MVITNMAMNGKKNDCHGYGRDSYNRDGYDWYGHDREEYDINVYDRDGYYVTLPFRFTV